MNILTGIFVEKAIMLATPDRMARTMQKRRADAVLAQDLREFLEDLDVDNSGTITREEFSAIAANPTMQAMLKVMGLDIRDASMFFDMVSKCGEDDAVEISLLAEALMRIKGEATSFDVQAVAFRTHMLGRRIEELHGALLRALKRGLVQVNDALSRECSAFDNGGLVVPDISAEIADVVLPKHFATRARLRSMPTTAVLA